MNNVIRSSETEGLAVYAKSMLQLQGSVIPGAVQCEAAADPATLLADASRAKPAFDVVVRAIRACTGATLELALLGVADKHGVTQTGLKKASRIVEKAALRRGVGRGRTECVCDVVRAMLVASDMATIAAIADAFFALVEAGIVAVVRIKDRFNSPSAGGWRDLMINFVVTGGSDSDATRHVCEVQIVHEMMLTARKGLPGHEIYAVVRNASELIESVGAEDELRVEAVRALRESGTGESGASETEVLQAFEDAWIVDDGEWITAAGGKTELARGLTADIHGRLMTVKLQQEQLKGLPVSVCRLAKLQTLHMSSCSSLASLPERLGDCTALQRLDMSGCSSLVSLPNLSELRVQVQQLPVHCQPWEDAGRISWHVL